MKLAIHQQDLKEWYEFKQDLSYSFAKIECYAYEDNSSNDIVNEIEGLRYKFRNLDRCLDPVNDYGLEKFKKDIK